MIHDFDQLEDGLDLEADICIIGSGVAGLTVARAFLGTNTNVIVVESGGWAIEDEARELNHGDVAGLPFAGLLEGRARAYGGTSNLWGGQCIPLDPIDFEERSWVPFSGWPLSGKWLAPYYDRAKERLWIPPDEYDDPVWARFGLDAIAFDPALLHVAHTIFIAQHNLGQRYRSELQAAPNVRILLHASVVRLETNAYGTQMRHARIRSLAGKLGRVAARVFVLCSGPVENARLLLLSDQASPEGLGNGYGNVGRFLQDHPVCRCAEVETQAPRQLQDHFNLLYGASARTLRPGRGRKYLPKIGISEDVQRRERVLNCVGQLEYEYSPNSAMVALKNLVIALHMGRRPERVASTAIKVALASPLLAHHAYRFAARGLTPSVKPARIYLDAISEQAPNPDSRVTLGSTLDKLGVRQARVDWQLRGLDWRTLLVFAKSVQAEFSRLGLGNVKITEWLAEGDMSQAHVRDNFHPAGTTRLAERARDGVVDTNCQVFGVDGLYISGSSIFPTSGTANPVLTITAMALRLSDHLKGKLVAAPELSVPVTA